MSRSSTLRRPFFSDRTPLQWSRNQFCIGGAKVGGQKQHYIIMSNKINDGRIHTWYSIIYTITWSLIIGGASPDPPQPPRFLFHCLVTASCHLSACSVWNSLKGYFLVSSRLLAIILHYLKSPQTTLHIIICHNGWSRAHLAVSLKWVWGRHSVNRFRISLWPQRQLVRFL